MSLFLDDTGNTKDVLASHSRILLMKVSSVYIFYVPVLCLFSKLLLMHACMVTSKKCIKSLLEISIHTKPPSLN